MSTLVGNTIFVCFRLSDIRKLREEERKFKEEEERRKKEEKERLKREKEEKERKKKEEQERKRQEERERLEREVEELGEAQRAVQARINAFDPARHGYTELTEWNEELEALAPKLERAEERWLELAERA